jgi:TRAP-type C4-dicarboxylate transport system permease small subunit
MDPILKFLSFLAQLCAVLAGLILTAVTLVTCVSLIGRNTTGWTLLGDYELTAVAAGAAVALFLPWCQLRRENIIVDFFTAKASPSVNAGLDRFGAFLLAAMMLVIAWRTAIGCLSAYESQTTSMMLGFPEWITYAAMVPPLVIAGVIALVQAFGPPQATDNNDNNTETLA